MLLSRDVAVLGLGLTQDERKGLDVAVSELRHVLGPVDAYLATYRNNGMNGPTVIFGRKEAGTDGRPFLSVSRVNGLHVLRFTMGSKKDREIMQRITRRATWRAMLDRVVFPLETLARDSAAFSATLQTVGERLKNQHPDLYERRVEGQSRMPADYGSDAIVDDPGDQLRRDLGKILTESDVTTRLQMTEARIGQGTFRREMLKLWGGACAVTGCRKLELIRASHAQPWAPETTPETWRAPEENPRLDPHNGLPLVGTLDLLFDAGLMTFDDDGIAIFADESVRQTLVASCLVPDDVRLLKAPGKELKHYLRIHRAEVFKDEAGRAE